LVTVKREDIKQVVKSLLMGEDYREDFLAVIDALYIEAYLEYFKKVVYKSNYPEQTNLNQLISDSEQNDDDKYNWYENLMLNPQLNKKEIALNAGINMKTITNMHNTTRREVVIDAAKKHFREFIGVLNKMQNKINQIDLKLDLKYGDIFASFDTYEVLFMINAMATIISNIRGGIYSSLGQQIEKPLMLTLSRMVKIPEEYYKKSNNYEDRRQTDFHYFINDQKINCEVKLMGKGNPESANSASARYTHIFIANKISDLQKEELKKKRILWLETQGNDNLLEDFCEILKELEIPHTHFKGNYKEHIEEYLENALDDLNI